MMALRRIVKLQRHKLIEVTKDGDVFNYEILNPTTGEALPHCVGDLLDFNSLDRGQLHHYFMHHLYVL
jgi:hypothetical protein